MISKQKSFLTIAFATLLLVLSSWAILNKKKPTIYVIGDSTVKNGSSDTSRLVGWGDCLAPFFDTTKITIKNHARGGRSSRTFQSEGLWDNVLTKLHPGDYVLMQFGHNDGSSLNTGRARGTIKGIGEETEEVIMEASGEKSTIHTYGWYMRKYIRESREKGAIPIILSPVPRNIWKDGKVERASESYGKWAKEIAGLEKVFFIDLNEITAKHYEKLGPDSVKAAFSPKDHTHTSRAGAELNAASLVEGLLLLESCPLNKYLKKP